MTAFLLKSAISLLVLLVLYKLLMEREKIHSFNRAYLLFAVAFSFAVPLISIPVYIEIEAATPVADTAFPVDTTPVLQQTGTNFWPYILYGIYGLVTVILFIRFALNIFAFIRKVRNNQKVKFGPATLVLLPERIVPYTFLNYIFVSREEYEHGLIEEELFTHELTHVRQYHTLDVILIELLKTIFWFNPLLYLYGRSIRLNHEFLADAQVIKTNHNAAQYQNLLLQKASGKPLALASSLNFALTKKRLLMMTKTTNRLKAFTLKTAVLPIAAALIGYMCPQEIYAQKITSWKDIPADKITRVDINKGITQTQIDSLKKADPAKYAKATTDTYFQIKIGYTDNKGKAAVMNVFEPNPKNGIVETPQTDEITIQKNETQDKYIDANLVRTINYYAATKAEVDSLRKVNPTKYEKAGVKYQKMVTTYANEDGTVKTRTEFIASTKFSNETLGQLSVKSYKTVQEEKVYSSADLDPMPEYSDGGIKGFFSYINSNFKIPESKEDITARIYVSFVVEKDGTMSNIKLMRDPGHGLGEEAIRVLNEVKTKWIPGEKDGKPVRASYHLPITINIRS